MPRTPDMEELQLKFGFDGELNKCATLNLIYNRGLSKALLAVIIGLSTAGCNDTGTPDGVASSVLPSIVTAIPEKGYVSGSVLDTSGHPISGAKVAIDNSIF